MPDGTRPDLGREMTATRWVIVVLIVLVLVGLIAFARGREHRRGDEEGALALRVPAASVR
jgi:hypothetical protein